MIPIYTFTTALADAVQLDRDYYDLQPDEIYNLGAQSHVRVSFDIPDMPGNRCWSCAYFWKPFERISGKDAVITKHHLLGCMVEYRRFPGGNDTIFGLVLPYACTRKYASSLVNG